jgi:uncharacterized cupin superfamily protein
MTEVIAPAIVDFARSTPERNVSRPSPDRLLAGQPEQVTQNFFSDATGQFFAGTWESSPGRWQVRYTENEFCHITRGRVRIEDAQGVTREFATGDSFVIPAGFEGIWQVLEPMSKLYVIFEPATR